MISPASMATDIFEAREFPMGRAATHEDVIAALAFFTSEEAYYINGANIEVNGGFVPGISKSD
jgi:NAD(P)-dependent dehydrogenase (short-subunit alcohol dehydrogenase family)